MFLAARHGRHVTSLQGRLRRLYLLAGDVHSFSSSSHRGSARRWKLLSAVLPMGHPGVSLVPALETWAKEKNNQQQQQQQQQQNKKKLFPGKELQDLVKELRGRKRFKQALEVSEWIDANHIIPFTSGDHAVQLDLVGRVRGLESAETYFLNLGKELKTQKTHGALLNCYVREGLIEESLSQFEKMKALGFVSTSLPYNNLMCLHTKTRDFARIPPLMEEMRKRLMLPDNLSYRLCINSYAARNLIAEMERTLEEMDCQPHLVVDWNTYSLVAHAYLRSGFPEKAAAAASKTEEKMNAKSSLCYNHLVSLHGAMKNKAEMWRLWNLQQDSGLKHLNRDYTVMLGELVKLGELDEAKNLLRIWENSGNTADIRVAEVVLAGLCDAGEVETGAKMIRDLENGGKALPLPSSWGILAKGFAQKGELNQARSYLEKALRGYEPAEGRWRPSPRLILGVLDWLRDQGRDIQGFALLLEPVLADQSMDDESKREILKILDAAPNNR